MKNVLKLLLKSIVIPLELSAAASATDASIHKKMFGFDCLRMLVSRPFDFALSPYNNIKTFKQINE